MNDPIAIHSPTHRKDIDGLRAIAILSVVIFHSGVPYFTGGFIGVDVFFVISGFLIGGIIYTEMKEARFSYSAFYTRRIKRIAPALFFMLIICTAISYFYLSPQELKDYIYYATTTVFSVPNIAMWRRVDYFAASSDLNPLLMTWSLGVEEQFYIFLPLFFTLLFRLKSRVLMFTIIVTVASFIFSIVLSKTYPLLSFYLPLTRAWELGIGVVLAILIKDKRITMTSLWLKEAIFLIGMASILLPCFIFDEDKIFPGYLALIPTIGSALVIVGSGRLSQLILCNKSMVFIGLVSYSWYLWHWPLLSFSRLAADENLTALQGVIVSVMALGVAYFSYRYIETPFRRNLKSTNKRVILNYMTLCIVVSIPLLAAYRLNGLPGRVNSTVFNAELDRQESIKNPCLVKNGKVNFSLNSYCIPKDINKQGVAILGDSHASALRGGIDDYAKKNNLVVYQLTKSSCPFLIGVTRSLRDFPAHGKECAKFNRNVMEYILSNNNITKVILAGFWDAGISEDGKNYGYTDMTGLQHVNKMSEFAVGLTNVVTTLVNNGKEVVIMKDIPFMNFDVVKAVSNNEIMLRREVNGLLSSDASTLDYSKDIKPENKNIDYLIDTLNQPGVSVYDPKKDLCSSIGCKFISNNRALYYDHQHLNRFGSILALRDLR